MESSRNSIIKRIVNMKKDGTSYESDITQDFASPGTILSPKPNEVNEVDEETSFYSDPNAGEEKTFQKKQVNLNESQLCGWPSMEAY